MHGVRSRLSHSVRRGGDGRSDRRQPIDYTTVRMGVLAVYLACIAGMVLLT